MIRSRARYFIVLIALSLPAAARAETTVLEGQHQVVLDIINPAGIKFIPDYKNAGFTQRVLETKTYAARVEITISLAPFLSREPYPIRNRVPEKVKPFLKPEPMVQAQNPAIQNLAQGLVGNSTTELQAFERLAHWVADKVRYEIDTPQDALSVYRNRAGSCAGQTRLMMALLRASGIPARYARGFLPPGGRWGFNEQYWGVTIKSGGFHAWLEVFFPDHGWVFSDILHSIHFVDPYHILFHIAGTELNPDYETTVTGEDGNIRMEEGTSFTVFKENDQSRVADSVSLPQRPLLSLRTGPQQSCAIFGHVLDPSGKPVTSGDFIFWRNGEGQVHPFGRNGSFGVSGFGKGTYTFSVRAQGFAEGRKKLTFSRIEAKEVNFQLEPGGSVFGKVTDLNGVPIANTWVYLWQGIKAQGYPTDSEGRYKIIGCPVGSIRLSVQPQGFQKAEAQVEIKPGAKVEKNFLLSP